MSEDDLRPTTQEPSTEPSLAKAFTAKQPSHDGSESTSALPIRMTGDHLLVRSTATGSEKKTRGGIVIPATAEVSRRLEWQSVVSVGPTAPTVEEGDQVLFPLEAAYEVEIGGAFHRVIREQNVLAVMPQRPFSLAMRRMHRVGPRFVTHQYAGLLEAELLCLVR